MPSPPRQFKFLFCIARKAFFSSVIPTCGGGGGGGGDQGVKIKRKCHADFRVRESGRAAVTRRARKQFNANSIRQRGRESRRTAPISHKKTLGKNCRRKISENEDPFFPFLVRMQCPFWAGTLIHEVKKPGEETQYQSVTWRIIHQMERRCWRVILRPSIHPSIHLDVV